MLSWLSSMRSKPITWLLHIALGIIILGACVTRFFGEQGEIHLRADHAQTLTCNPSPVTRNPSSVTLFLWDFQVVNDSDNNPADYITELRLLNRGTTKTTQTTKKNVIYDQ